MSRSFSVRIVGTEVEFPCSPERSILHNMFALGRKGIPRGCYGGGCGVCKIKIEKGAYHTLKMSREQVSEAEEAEGYALACRIFAEGDMVLRVVGKMQRALSK